MRPGQGQNQFRRKKAAAWWHFWSGSFVQQAAAQMTIAQYPVKRQHLFDVAPENPSSGKIVQIARKTGIAARPNLFTAGAHQSPGQCPSTGESARH